MHARVWVLTIGAVLGQEAIVGDTPVRVEVDEHGAEAGVGTGDAVATDLGKGRAGGTGASVDLQPVQSTASGDWRRGRKIIIIVWSFFFPFLTSCFQFQVC